MICILLLGCAPRYALGWGWVYRVHRVYCQFLYGAKYHEALICSFAFLKHLPFKPLPFESLPFKPLPLAPLPFKPLLFKFLPIYRGAKRLSSLEFFLTLH